MIEVRATHRTDSVKSGERWEVDALGNLTVQTGDKAPLATYPAGTWFLVSKDGSVEKRRDA